MFAKGPRFPPEKPSITPGPNHYTITTEESRLETYKKGAFLEKADRFGPEKGSDAPGPGTYNVGPRDSNPRPGPSRPLTSNPGLTHLQQQIEVLKSQNAKLTKEHQQTIRKYEDKVTHNESTIRSLVKDNVALQSQVSTQQKEHRSVCQREAALRAALDKAEASTKGDAERATKLAGLQRKLQDIEKIHSDEKKRHQAEVEQLKCELDASRKTSTEQKERVALLRKQQETSESHMKDLKRTIIADQAEIKELRTKAQSADQVKTQAASRQGELEQLKKSLQDLETKYNAELQSRNLNLAQQEKVLESRRMEAAEQQAGNVKSRADQETKEARDHSRRLKEELDALTWSAEEAKAIALQEKQHLADTRVTMVRVAEAYGHLAASSIPLDVHRQSELQCASLRLRNIRLERRLADREALVEQLTNYCRQASEEKFLLARLLREAEDDQRVLLGSRHLANHVVQEDNTLICSLLDGYNCNQQLHDTIVQTDLHFFQTLGCFYQTQFNDSLVAYAMAERENAEQSLVAEHLMDGCTGLQAEVDALRLNHGVAEAELSKKSVQVAEALAREQALNERLAVHQRELTKLEGTLKKERETSERLAQTSHQNKRNEDHLRLEIDELIEDLADVTRYKEAHADLLSEVVELIQRNELAEAEADRLGRFNAEILGNTNPQQKIFYVDRIRRELAETKHQLLRSTRDREDLAADNAALYHEVAVYKSIAVPIEQKPRGTRVRIERTPLATRSINGSTESITFEITPPPQEEPIDTSPMTLDEIM